MKRTFSLLLFCLVFLSIARAADPVSPQEQQLVAVIAELRAQQIQLVENQARMEAKLATIAEAVRIARIYSSRGGD